MPRVSQNYEGQVIVGESCEIRFKARAGRAGRAKRDSHTSPSRKCTDSECGWGIPSDETGAHLLNVPLQHLFFRNRDPGRYSGCMKVATILIFREVRFKNEKIHLADRNSRGRRVVVLHRRSQDFRRSRDPFISPRNQWGTPFRGHELFARLAAMSCWSSSTRYITFRHG
jgi:hypothetical protein